MEHLHKYGLHINNIGTRILAKSLILSAEAIGHAEDSSNNANPENLINLNENDSTMPICQFFEHQIADSDCNLSGLSGSTTENIEALCGSFRRAAPFVEHFVVLYNKIIFNQGVMY